MKFFRRNSYPRHLNDTNDLSLSRQAIIFTWELFKVVVISLAIIIPVRYYLIKPFYVQGASMEPNFHDYEYLIIDEISYRFNEPERGEVVVFRFPLNPEQFFIKRVIGLPGETVKITDGDVYIINDQHPAGIKLNEGYLPAGRETSGTDSVTLGSEQYYLLGDNRPLSLDSRNFGPLNRDLIVGRTLLRGWPLKRFGIVLNNIEYNL